MKSDYPAHDAVYQRLRNKGAAGWGDETFTERMKGWARSLSRVEQDRHFPKAPAAVLELGCGAGDVSQILAQQGYAMAGIDISPTAIEWARDKFAKLKLSADFRAGSVCELPWETSSFDVAVDGNCLHCIIGEDRGRVFREVHRVLRPAGFFLVSAMVGEPKDEIGRQGFDFATRCQMNGDVATRYMPEPDALMTEIESFGFKVIHSSISKNEWWDHLEVYAIR